MIIIKYTNNLKNIIISLTKLHNILLNYVKLSNISETIV